MTRKFRWLGLSALVAIAAAAAACGDDEKPKAPSLCEGVFCTGDSVCNPDTGACVCGDTALTCEDGTVCSLDPSPTCISDRCEFTSCTGGQSCDPRDGICKCNGVTCGSNEQCIQGACVTQDLCEGVVCSDNETCDPDDGTCRCGDGAGCQPGQRCDEGVCINDLCAGKSCGSGMVCSPDDGLCHCGGAEGPICGGTQTCVVDEAGARCEGVDLCADAATRCGAGTTCDRADGSCRCGVGTDAPVCSDGQTCHDGRCVGGDLCAGATCAGGTSCDPEDGLCKCGGLFGDICGADQACFNDGSDPVCVKTCNPLLPTECGTGEGCYFDPHTEGGGTRFCAPAGRLPQGSSCRLANECATGLFCDLPEGAAVGRCQPFCDVGERPQCGGQGICAPLNSDIENLGFCLPR